MGANSNIAWTDNTWNPWWGCTEVGPGCDFCYARIFAARLGKAKWGDDVPRVRTSTQVWDSLDTWERKAIKTGVPIKVFCASMSDFFENHPDVGPWRTEGWERIKRCPHLRFQILTKRGSNIPKMLPDDWGPAYAHVGFMCTVVNPVEAARDVPRLLKVKRDHGVTWIGLSIEPFLEPILLQPEWLDAGAVDWIIIGGESARGEALAECRHYNMNAALGIITACVHRGVPVFHKQLGSRPIYHGQRFAVGHWKGELPAQWPAEFKVQQFPGALLS